MSIFKVNDGTEYTADLLPPRTHYCWEFSGRSDGGEPMYAISHHSDETNVYIRSLSRSMIVEVSTLRMMMPVLKAILEHE